METLHVLTTRNFNGVELKCYEAENADDFFATREQIGELLGYRNPRDAIKDIHNRNAARLNKFSTKRKLIQVEGSRAVTRDAIVYNFKGLLEICRYSNQPKADAVIDFLWDIADAIRKKGYYATPVTAEAIIANPLAFIDVLKKRFAIAE